MNWDKIIWYFIFLGNSMTAGVLVAAGNYGHATFQVLVALWCLVEYAIKESKDGGINEPKSRS